MHKMDMRTRHEYLKALLGRYLKARKRGKTAILNEYCQNTGLHRKSAVRKIARLLRGEPLRRKKKTPIYDYKVRTALEIAWNIFDRPCGQRLKPLLEEEVDRLRRQRELKIDNQTAQQLKSVSSATIDRLLKPKKAVWVAHKPFGTPGPNLIAKKIPIRLTDWNLTQVGYLEMDLVLHGGTSTEGDFGHSLSALEISSGWWEGEAVMGRSQVRIFKGINEIRNRTPFTWKGIDTDNDNAFINDQLYRYTQKEALYFTRSRPYRKNDNARIEQKNYTHVRRPLGYLRYDTPEELDLINDLYHHELRLFKNFFQPVMRLKSKERIDGHVQRQHERPRTPYRILRESGQLSEEQIKRMDDLYRDLNPAELKRQIEKKLLRLYALYEKKKKKVLQVNPYQPPDPSSVTFFMIQHPNVR